MFCLHMNLWNCRTFCCCVIAVAHMYLFQGSIITESATTFVTVTRSPNQISMRELMI